RDGGMGSEALLLGRKTYAGVGAAWPSREGEFADKLNSMTKYVVPSAMSDPEWTNSHVIAPDGDLAASIAQVRQQVAGTILVNGSVRLVRALLAHGLVDELRLMVYPTILGAGLRLWDERTPAPSDLQLVESRPAGQTLILRYTPAV